MAPHCPTSPTDVSSLLTVSLIFSLVSKHDAASCNRCRRKLTVEADPIYTECGCLWCPDCFDVYGPLNFRPTWTQRSDFTRREDRVGTCNGLKRVGEALEICSAELISETQVYQFKSFLLKNPLVASELGFTLTSLPSSSLPPSSLLTFPSTSAPTSPLPDNQSPHPSGRNPTLINLPILPLPFLPPNDVDPSPNPNPVDPSMEFNSSVG